MSEPENSFKFKNLPWGWILLGMTLWFLFPWIYSVLFSLIIKNPEYYGDKFGAVGDIYGSLNTLISSMALCAVAYSTTLQVKELRLARKTYTDQLNESKYSNFTNIFYSLLNHKNLNYKNLMEVGNEGEKIDAQEIFSSISDFFVQLNRSIWGETLGESSVVKRELTYFLHRNFNNSLYIKLDSHFIVYGDLIYLIKKSELNCEDKIFFYRLISNSMTVQEQMSLIWFSAFNVELKNELNGSGIIKIGYSQFLFQFFTKFHDKSLFSDSELLMEWEKLETQNKTPA